MDNVLTFRSNVMETSTVLISLMSSEPVVRQAGFYVKMVSMWQCCHAVKEIITVAITVIKPTAHADTISFNAIRLMLAYPNVKFVMELPTAKMAVMKSVARAILHHSSGVNPVSVSLLVSVVTANGIALMEVMK
jgi:hypothetical protein